MNIYKYYTNPEELPGYTDRMKLVPQLAYEHIMKMQAPKPDLEPVIAKNAKYSYFYAQRALKKAFPLGEPAIAKSAQFAYVYATYVLKSRFEKGESAIKDSTYQKAYEKKFKVKL